MRRTSPGGTTVLDARSPTVLLSPLQSGVGATTFELVSGRGVDVRLGCIFQLRSGYSTVRRPGDVTRGSDPIALPARAEAPTARMDMLRSRALARLIVIADVGGPPGSVSGTLIVTTYGGARIEVPLARPAPAGVLVLASLYRLSGEFVVRAEQAMILDSVRAAALAYGFERIAWADESTAIS